MENLCLYNGKVYNKVYNFKYNTTNFTICTCENKLVYFKHDIVNDLDVYTPYDRWIKAMNADSLIKDRIKLDTFIDYLNKNKITSEEKINKLVKNGFGVKTKRKRKIGIFNKYMIILLISIIGFTFGGVSLFNYYNEGKDVDKMMKTVLKQTTVEEKVAFTASEIPEVSGEAYENHKYGEDYWNYMKTTMMSVDFSKLKQVNSDTKGWLYVNNTNVNYPFVQGSDNSYYLNHSFDKSYNIAGWLFADYKSNLSSFGKNTVIYGHGRVESVMFGSLDKVLSESWYTNKDNQIIKLSTENKNTLWQIVSIYTVPSESYYLTHTFENDASYQKFIDTMLSRSIYDFKTNVDVDDKILTLSTCLDFDGNRIVVQAKLLKEQNR